MPFDFAALEQEFTDAQPPETAENKDPPDGKYDTHVHKVEIKEAKNSGKPYVKWQLIIDGGPQNGRYLFRNNQMASKENLAWLKKDLAVCGITLAKLADLESRLPELLDKRIKVTKKTRNADNYNVYFDKMITAEQKTAQPEPAGGPGNDGLPF